MSSRGRLAALLVTLGVMAPCIARATATLAYVEESAFTDSLGQSMSISPDGTFVYSSGWCGGCAATDFPNLTVFRRDGVTGRLTFVQQVSAIGNAYHALSPDAVHLYAGSDDRLQAYARDPVTGMISLLASYQEGVGGISDLINVRKIVVSPDGRHVYVSGARNGVVVGSTVDAIVMFVRDQTTGLLTYLGSEIGGNDDLHGIADLAISPDGLHLYAAGGQNALDVYTRNPLSGVITFTTTYVDGVGGLEELRGVGAVLVSPDGAHVYVTALNDGRNLTFARNPLDGTLTLLQAIPTLGLLAAIGPGADVLYDQYANAWERNPLTGHLTLVDQPVGPFLSALGEDVVASPDDRHVYMGLWNFGLFPVLTWQRVGVRCSSTPLPGCRIPSEPGKAFLKVLAKDERVTWKWLRGAATEVAAFGDPAGDDDYALCLYDAGGGDQPAVRTLLPAGALCGATAPCWKAVSAGFNYSDYLRTPEGVKKMRLRAGPDGQAKITLAAREVPALALPLTPPVTAQLQAENGECWQAVYSTPLASDAAQFKARAD